MRSIKNKILFSISISLCMYVLIALVLIVVDRVQHSPTHARNNFEYDELKYDYGDLPVVQHFVCRDDSRLAYRYYASKGNTVFIFIHGSGWHGKYLHKLAFAVSQRGLGHVYIPDLRGHGVDPDRRGDIDYISQLEDDLADLIEVVRKRHPDATLVLGGHSSGGGLAIRFAGSVYEERVDGFVLLAPFLKYNAPTTRENSGGWASAHLPRIIGLVMLNNIGIRGLNSLPVLDFNMPEEYRDGTETLTYSYRLMSGYAPEDYRADLASIRQPTIVMVGEADESFYADRFHDEINRYNGEIEVEVLPGLSHMGIVVANITVRQIEQWLEKHSAQW